MSFTPVPSKSSAQCWGFGGSGRLGVGSEDDHWVPQQVQGLDSGVTTIAAGDSHTCAIQRGSAQCWGFGGSGRLGTGDDAPYHSTPRQVQGLESGVTAIAAGNSHTCAFSAVQRSVGERIMLASWVMVTIV